MIKYYYLIEDGKLWALTPDGRVTFVGRTEPDVEKQTKEEVKEYDEKEWVN